MEIKDFSNLSFQSRNKTIRFADDIARHVNKCYPRISSSIVDDFVNIQCFRGLKKQLGYNIREKLRYDISKAFDDGESFIKKIKAFIKPIRKHRLGNCGESAQLSAIVGKTNGLKNSYIANLETVEHKGLDHSVLYVNDKKPYVVDAWLGFADYVPNAIQRYKNEFGYHFDIADGDKITFKKLETDYAQFLNQDFSRSQINKIKKVFPEQYKRRGYV